MVKNKKEFDKRFPPIKGGTVKVRVKSWEPDGFIEILLVTENNVFGIDPEGFEEAYKLNQDWELYKEEPEKDLAGVMEIYYVFTSEAGIAVTPMFFDAKQLSLNRASISNDPQGEYLTKEEAIKRGLKTK